MVRLERRVQAPLNLTAGAGKSFAEGLHWVKKITAIVPVVTDRRASCPVIGRAGRERQVYAR